MLLKRSRVLTGLTALAVVSVVVGSSLATAAPAAQIEPSAGTWPTWLITSGEAQRLPPPPGPADTQAELADLQTLAVQRDGATLDRIGY